MFDQITGYRVTKSSANAHVLPAWVGSIALTIAAVAFALAGCDDQIRHDKTRSAMRMAYVDMDLPDTRADVAMLRSSLDGRGMDTSGLRFIAVAQLGEPERLTRLIEKVAEFQPNLILATGTNEAKRLHLAFPNTPMLFLSPVDPRRAGLATALGAPEKNASGVSFYQPVEGKQLELLKLCTPKLKSVAILVDQSVTEATELSAYESAGAELELAVEFVWLAFESDSSEALRKLQSSDADAWLIPVSHSAIKHRETLLKYFKTRRVPALWGRTKVLSVGGAFAHDDSLNDWHAVWAKQVLLLSQGLRPAAIPIERPTGFDFGLNVASVTNLHRKPPKACVLRANLFVD